MQENFSDPGNKKKQESGGDTFSVQPDQTPRREGGDDALAETSPTDSRADEKVIVNEQAENKTVNVPSQTGAGTNKDSIDGNEL